MSAPSLDFMSRLEGGIADFSLAPTDFVFRRTRNRLLRLGAIFVLFLWIAPAALLASLWACAAFIWETTKPGEGDGTDR